MKRSDFLFNEIIKRALVLKGLERAAQPTMKMVGGMRLKKRKKEAKKAQPTMKMVGGMRSLNSCLGLTQAQPTMKMVGGMRKPFKSCKSINRSAFHENGGRYEGYEDDGAFVA